MKVFTASAVVQNLSRMQSVRNLSISCGDTRDFDVLRNVLGGHSSFQLADALVTDPPYCLLERRRKSGELRDPKIRQRKLLNHPTTHRYTNVKEYEAFSMVWLRNALRCIKSGGVVIIWTNSLGKAPIRNSCETLGCYFLGEFLWSVNSSDSFTPLTNKRELNKYVSLMRNLIIGQRGQLH